MKAVSGKTWVQKAVFFEPKPLFSSALTIWRRGWYLCMELSIICTAIEEIEEVRLTNLSCFPPADAGTWTGGQLEPKPNSCQDTQISWKTFVFMTINVCRYRIKNIYIQIDVIVSA